MRIYTREDGESNWAAVALVMTVIVVVLIMGYIFWYNPSRPVAEAPRHDVIVNTPATVAAAPPSTVIIPSQGPAGPAGATGAAGATGSPGAAGTDKDKSDDSKSDDRKSGASSDRDSGDANK